MMADTKRIYTFEEFSADITNLETQIQWKDRKYDLIIGVVRGGLFPAGWLSHRLGVPMKTIIWRTRDGDTNYIGDEVYNHVARNLNRTLIVDDIIDSGITVDQILEAMHNRGINTKKVDVASLMYNPDQQLITPTYFARSIPRDTDKRWVEFWWEQ